MENLCIYLIQARKRKNARKANILIDTYTNLLYYDYIIFPSNPRKEKNILKNKQKI